MSYFRMAYLLLLFQLRGKTSIFLMNLLSEKVLYNIVHRCRQAYGKKILSACNFRECKVGCEFVWPQQVGKVHERWSLGSTKKPIICMSVLSVTHQVNYDAKSWRGQYLKLFSVSCLLTDSDKTAQLLVLYVLWQNSIKKSKLANFSKKQPFKVGGVVGWQNGHFQPHRSSHLQFYLLSTVLNLQ